MINQDTIKTSINAIANTVDGQIILNYILFNLCNINNSTYSSDAMVMAYNTGRHDVGLEIKQLIDNNFINQIEDLKHE